MERSKLTGWHSFPLDHLLTCALCRKTYSTLEAAAGDLCEQAAAEARRSCENVLWAIKEVLAVKHEKVTPMSGPDAGKRIKQKIDATEKLVRICAALHSLLVDDLKEAINAEAVNRLAIAKISGRKPWQ